MNDAQNTTTTEKPSAFGHLDLHQDLLDALERLEFDAPTEVQTQMIPAALDGRDCIARASTGDGKTNAFMLPILQKAVPGEGLQAIILEPTRALALQLQKNMGRFAPERVLKTAVAGGGQRQHQTTDVFADNPDVLIATPRGVRDLIGDEDRDWSTVRTVVIDELDAMLDDRQGEPLDEVCNHFSHEHQTLITSATLDGEAGEWAKRILHDPAVIEPAVSPPKAAQMTQSFYPVEEETRFDILLSFLKQGSPKLAIIFANDDDLAGELTDRLTRARVNCRWANERGRRDRRDNRNRGRRDRSSEAVIVNDPAPRRLSLVPATHVLHYELPADMSTYNLRLAQCSRLRRRGEVIALIGPEERDRYSEFASDLGQETLELEPPPIPERAARRTRREEPRKEPAHTPSAEALPPTPVTKKSADAAQRRLDEPLLRDAELDSRGVKPMPRTLGSRFRTSRRPRTLRRTPPPATEE